MLFCFFFSSRRRHTRCALVTGVQTCALPISGPRFASGAGLCPTHSSNQSSEIAILVVTLPLVREPANDLQIARRIMSIGVYPIEGRSHIGVTVTIEIEFQVGQGATFVLVLHQRV